MALFGLGKKALAAYCDQMATMIDAGLTARAALATLERSAPGAQLKTAVGHMGLAIEGGSTLADAMEREGVFTPLLIDMVRIGEESGALVKVLFKMRDYYEFMRSLQIRFLTRLIYPAIEIILAIGVMGAVAWIMAFVSHSDNGTANALSVWGAGYGAILGLIVLYYVVTRLLGGLAIVHELLLCVPVVRYVMQSVALARFSLSMEMMYDAGLSMLGSLERSFKATGNGAFQWRTARVVKAVTEGSPVHEALAPTGLFPIDYTETIRVAEESGSLTDAFRRLSARYFERAERAMAAAAVAFGWLIWLGIAGVIIYFIFKMAMMYMSIINQAMNG